MRDKSRLLAQLEAQQAKNAARDMGACTLPSPVPVISHTTLGTVETHVGEVSTITSTATSEV